jgi:hypothetical protein
MGVDAGLAVAPRDPLAERKRHRNPDCEQENGEDQVIEMAAVPRDMLELGPQHLHPAVMRIRGQCAHHIVRADNQEHVNAAQHIDADHSLASRRNLPCGTAPGRSLALWRLGRPVNHCARLTSLVLHLHGSPVTVHCAAAVPLPGCKAFRISSVAEVSVE